MKYGSVCSGIEAATMAWHPLGWHPSFFSEIEKFPSAVLAHRYPHVANHGDMTKFEEWPDHAIDLLVGGTPCQSFSVAGLRQGLADPRGNLMLTYLAIARRYQPRWLVWENVPGVLSSNGGRDFGTFVRGLEECGYHAAWRVLDAQYVRVDGFARAVPQRRRRVFVVGYLGDWRRAAAVLFEREGLSGDSAPRREAGQGFAYGFAGGPTDGIAKPLGAHSLSKGRGSDLDNTTYTLAVRGRGDGHQLEYRQDGTANAILTPNGGRAGIGVGAIAFGWQNSESQGASISGEITPTLDKSKTPAVAFTCSEQANSFAWERDVYPTLDAQIPNDTSNIQKGIRQGWAVRRLTPRECERLQGFADDFTLVPAYAKVLTKEIEEETLRYIMRGNPGMTQEEARRWASHPDGPRYKALGNSMAVNVMRWIGERIQHVEAISQALERAA